MSERANGWLLILGGLAIGLVLWLSPSRGGSSVSLGAIARRTRDALVLRLTERAQSSCLVGVGEESVVW